MNYVQIYNNIVIRARGRMIMGYTETHHIIPRCMGGDDNKENLVVLTAREHYICHKLLCEIYPGHRGLSDAVWMMANMKNEHRKISYKVGSREYERLRVECSKRMSEWRMGKKLSEETKIKIGESNRGGNHPFYGKTHTEESKRMIGESRKGKYKGADNSNPKKVINIITKEIYDCGKSAWGTDIERHKSYEYFNMMLRGCRRNKTDFVYLKDYV